MKKKSIRFIIGSLAVGGAERHLSYILPELRKKGWHVRVITLSEQIDGDLIPYLRRHQIQISPLPKSRLLNIRITLLRRALRLIVNSCRLWQDFIIDRNSITHFFLPNAYILGSISAKLAFNHAPMLMSRRSLNNYQKNKPLIKSIEIKLHKSMDVILGNSLAIVQQLEKEELVPANRLGLIYNGIPIDPQQNSRQANFRIKEGFAENDYLITIVANLLAYKGHDDLLTALSLIKDKLGSHWRLLVVGRDDGIGNHLSQLATSFNIDQHISWMGKRDDVNEILAATDLGILCSHEEGFSNAIVESMSFAVPMVVTNVGGNAEAILDKECGLVVPAKTPEALAEAILWMFEHQSEAKQLGIEAQKRVQQCFTVDRCVLMYENLYESLLQGRTKDARAVSDLLNKQNKVGV